MATTDEYNKIHAMAYARKLVMQKFGPDVIGTLLLAHGGFPTQDPLKSAGLGRR